MKKKSKIETGKNNILKESFVKGQTYKDVYNKKELWRELADSYNGKFKIHQTINKDINSFILEIPYKDYVLILTETDTKPLKFETEIKLIEKFEFNISWENGIEKILKLFRKKDINVNDKEFDKKYLIQSNKPELIIRVLNTGQIKQSVLRNNIYLMNLQYSKKNKIYKLMIVKDRNTKKIELMNDLIKLVFSLIDFFINENLIKN